MKKQGNVAQSKEHSRSLETDPKETEVYELIDKEFKITVIKILNSGKQFMSKMRISTDIEI